MRDLRTSSDPARLYETLTRRLARKLTREGAPQIGDADVAVVSELLGADRARPADRRFWLSVHADGSLIDASRAAMARLGLAGPGEGVEGLRGGLKELHGASDVIAVQDLSGQMILCHATRVPEARHWLLEELTFPAGPDVARSVSALWKLTQVEAEIALALLAGEAPAGIAARTGRAIGTVRQVIKAVLGKMQVHSRAEAVARLALVALARERGAMPGANSPAKHILPLRDATGSALVLWRFGAAGGQPILFFHGALFGIFSSPHMIQTAQMFGVDIIAPERPGYGMTAFPEGGDPVALTVARARAALRMAGVKRVQLLAHDVGTAYAFAFARAHPECVSAIVCAPATPPMTGWAQTADMPPLHRVSAFVTQKAPALMETLIRLGVKRAAREGLKAIPQMVFADSDHDRDVLLRPESYPVLETLYLSVTEQQAAGFLKDMFVTNLDWSDWLPDISCPVRLLHGGRSRTVSKAALQEVCGALADARLTVLPDAGHTLPITHPGHAFRHALVLSGHVAGP